MGGSIISEMHSNNYNAKSFLIVSLRFLGDVLVTTPLAYSIKKHFPNARVDYLVFSGTEGILAKNPYVDSVLTMHRGSRSPALIASLWNKYDIALSTTTSDRMTIFSIISGKRSYSLLSCISKEWWKKKLLEDYCHYNDNINVVHNMLSLLELLDIPKQPRVVMGYDACDQAFVSEKLGSAPYIILHPYSRGVHKYWSEKKWGILADLIQSQLGLRPIFSITPDAADQAFFKRIVDMAPSSTHMESFGHQFSLNQLAVATKNSVAYIGIDTVVTHIAAAVGASTIALYGPTLTKYWAPWPNGCTEASPFAANKGVQHVGNVTVIQKDWPCVPCNRETCSISTRGKMECLEELTPDEVFGELKKALGGR